jgi:hypothetical protein
MTWTYSGDSRLKVRIDTDRRAVVDVPDTNWHGSETITFKATDPGGLFSENSAIFSVTAVNDAPLNLVPGSHNTAEDTGLVLSPPISISDVDADDGVVAVTLTATHGVLTLSTAADLTFTAGDGTGDAAVRFTATIPVINNALNGMRFDPDADYFGDATVVIRTDDQGHSGSGGPQTDTDTVRIAVSAVNDPPSAAIATAFSGSEGQSILFSGSAADIDSAALTYFWDFDYNGAFTVDASGRDLATPQWTYADDGTYTVALRVEDGDGGQLVVGDPG